MKHGCTVMTQKQSSSLRNGRRRPLHDRKKRTKFTATSRKCWSFFLTLEEFCIRSLFHLVRLSMGIFTARFWDNWGKVRHKRPEMWKNRDLLLHHENAPAHTWLIVREFLTNSNMTTVPHPAYSPDLAPCDFCVFPKMKLRLKEWHFISIEEIQAESQQVLNTLTPADFTGCFQKWQNCWDHCIQAQGDYFERDSGN